MRAKRRTTAAKPPSDARLLAELPPLTRAERRRLVDSALAESKSGAPGVPHARVMAWLASLDTPNPLPKPRAAAKVARRA
jgi:hypothetical protein